MIRDTWRTTMRLLPILFALFFAGEAFAQSSPNFVQGQVPSAAQWNSYFAVKQDWGGAISFQPAGNGGIDIASPPSDCNPVPATAVTAPGDTLPSAYFTSGGVACLTANPGPFALPSMTFLDFNHIYNGSISINGDSAPNYGGLQFGTGGADAAEQAGTIQFFCFPSEPSGVRCPSTKVLGAFDPRDGSLGGLYVTDYIHSSAITLNGANLLNTTSGNLTIAPNSAITLLQGAAPQLYWQDLGQTTDKTLWSMESIGGNILLQAVNDAFSSVTSAYEILRGAANNVAGHIWFTSTVAGTAVEGMKLSTTGLNVGPSGTTEGAGTVNADTGYYANAVQGVTCSGAPTGSFAVTGGIVTHC